MADQEKIWRVIYVASRSEKIVALKLIEKKIHTYLPLIKTMKQWSDRKKIVELPLLSGYVFVQIDPTENEKVMQTKGVVNFVREEGKLAKVREEEIDRLKQLIELGYHVEARGYDKEYKKGDKIKIGSGPLKGLEGYITTEKHGKYFEIILETIKQSIRVNLPEDILVAIN